ncbi:MAG TPA: putative Ig domain-containing protein [Steroidobacter sp.]|nr:putative Ig domain-containing protein [Steroidobacter sp.]
MSGRHLIVRKRAVSRVAVLLIASAALAGCLDEKPEDRAAPLEPSLTNATPQIQGIPPAYVAAAGSLAFLPSASDADNDLLEFSITNLPSWAQFNDETGALTGSPTEGDVGETQEITITVTDGKDSSSIGPFTLNVKPSGQPPPDNTAPTISGTPPTSSVVGRQYTFTPTASDANGDQLRFSISNRPSWLSFDASTGQLSGTPRAGKVGTYSNIVISVSDGYVRTSLPAFSIQVQAVDNRTPTISGTPATSVQATQSYSFRPDASDPDNDPLTFSIVNRPAWASLDAASGLLSGTPSSANVGVYSNIVISVSDGKATASLPAFSISVADTANSAPRISGTPPSNVLAGVAYSFTPAASDADNDTLGFTIQNRPSWATLDTATGRLSGTPSSSNVGVYSNIVISVSDGKASASLPPFSITVQAPTNSAPTISGVPPTRVDVGSTYSFRPTASDPNGDTLAFSIQNRPLWATFNTATGALTGAPTTSNVGTYSNIIISVSDGQSSAFLPAFAITVAQPTTSGSATLSWTPPTQNTDGSALTNLAGFRIAYGTSPSALNQSIQIANPSVTSYVVSGLSSGVWYFAVRAYASTGVESALSNAASKTIP